LVVGKVARLDEHDDGLCPDLQHDDAEDCALTKFEAFGVEPRLERVRTERNEVVEFARDGAVELDAGESAEGDV
jgi:hypothetical protein